MTGPQLQDFYAKPVTRFAQRCNVTQTENYGNHQVDYCYNQHGYRTHEFSEVLPGHILVSGCSLTEGVGLPVEHTWPYLLEQELKQKVVNLAVGGSNAEFNNHNVTSWVCNGHRPSMAIIQWPSVYRMTTFSGSSARFVLNQSLDPIYIQTLKMSGENFVYKWVSSIINTNRLLEAKNIPVINLFFESADAMETAGDILNTYNIKIHCDEKIPGSTWHFDSKAYDNSHHSLWCTQQWTERIVRIINEPTTR